MKKTKRQAYEDAVMKLDAIISDAGGKYQLDEIGKMATICSVLKREFPHLLYIGFYRVTESRILQIGPYQGEVVACGTIPFGKGVCGACAVSEKAILVPDVSKFPGYIACDDETRSEIVVPVKRNGILTSVLDLDSGKLDDFNHVDKKYLKLIVNTFFS